MLLLLLVNIFCFRVNLCRLLFRLSPFLHPFAKLILYMCLFYFLSVWRFRFSSRRMQKRNENPPDIRTFRCWQFLCNGIRARQRLRSVRNREIDCVRARGEERSTPIQRERVDDLRVFISMSFTFVAFAIRQSLLLHMCFGCDMRNGKRIEVKSAVSRCVELIHIH